MYVWLFTVLETKRETCISANSSSQEAAPQRKMAPSEGLSHAAVRILMHVAVRILMHAAMVSSLLNDDAHACLLLLKLVAAGNSEARQDTSLTVVLG